MLIIKGKEYKLRRNISIDFKNKILYDFDISGNIQYLYEIYKIQKDCSFKKLIEIINCFNTFDNSRMIYNYINNIGYNDFKTENFIKYMNYKADNPKDTSSTKFYKALYGNNWNLKIKERAYNIGFLYNRDYISKKNNISLEEADLYINKFKEKKATNIDGFIKRHGEERGNKIFENFKKTSKHTLGKYLELYGISDGNKKWNEYINKKSVTSAFNKNFWVSKGFSEKDAIEKVKFISDNSSLDYFRRKYKCEDIAKKEFIKYHRKRNVKFNNASKESLIYFERLTNILIENGFKNKDILYGIEGIKSEHYIFNERGWYLYDYTILSHKIIIEYHGERWHPNPNRMSIEEWYKWRGISTGMTANDKYQRDEHKKKTAIDNGYLFLEIWSKDSFEYNWNKMISFIETNTNKKIKIYEN